MKFSVERADMAKALATAGRAVSARTTMPVLECVMMSADADRIILKTSDTEMNIITSVSAHISMAGNVLVPYKRLAELIDKYPDGTVYFNLDEHNTLYINCAQSDVAILCRNADEFPDFKALVTDFTPVGAEDLKSLIRETAFACAPEISINPVLTGVNMEYEGGKLTFTALDGYKLASRNIALAKQTDEPVEAIIPGRILGEILKIVSLSADKPEFAVADNMFVLQSGVSQVQCCLLNGPYINYRALITTEVNTMVNADRAALLASVERASLITDETHNSLIKLDITDEQVTIASNSDIGSITEVVSLIKTGADLKIAFNARYIMEILKTVRDERVLIEFRDRTGPCIIRPVDGESYLYLVMPVRYSE